MWHLWDELAEFWLQKALLVSYCRLWALREDFQVCICNCVVTDAGIVKIIRLMEDHERVPASAFGRTAIKITNSNHILILALAECPLVVGRTGRISRSMSH